jgi:glycosyltransferase involved in cell wall biosynthesis
MEKKRTRILYIIDALGPGGTERRLVQLLKRLTEKEFSAKLILLTDIVHYIEVYDLNVEVIKLERKIRLDPIIFFKLYKICRKWRPDIIHAWGSMPAIYAGPVAKTLRIKMINAMIADAPMRLNAKQKIRAFFSFPFSEVIQANSQAGLKAYSVPAKKGNFVHNGFDFERIGNMNDRSSIMEELNISTRYVAGMVAGLKYHKDYDSLIEAALEILKHRDDVTFVCVGDGLELTRIEKMAGGNDKIIFTGNRNDVESIIDIFDIGLLLTNLERHGEGISNSIMEYMALSKPVIATDGGGTRELVKDGETGFLIPQRSPAILAERINCLLNDDKLRSDMGIRGRERIEKEFNIDKMTGEHMSLYRALVSG